MATALRIAIDIVEVESGNTPVALQHNQTVIAVSTGDELEDLRIHKAKILAAYETHIAELTKEFAGQLDEQIDLQRALTRRRLEREQGGG